MEELIKNHSGVVVFPKEVVKDLATFTLLQFKNVSSTSCEIIGWAVVDINGNILDGVLV